MSKVLVVDDEETLRLVLSTLLEQHGYDVHTAPDGRAALMEIERWRPDFVFADVRMPGMTGIELCAAIKERSLRATVIVMSAYGSTELAIEAMKQGAYDYISKPFEKDEVLLLLRKAEEREALRKENRALRTAIHTVSGRGRMLGQSESMKQLFHTVAKVAEYKTTVLIQGESGTGKELVARALHDQSPRADKAFVAINCGAIPENLLESELFGHRRGAFTDASADKPGLFEQADGGTLFLDEIGELPLALQVKLLRVLQEETVRRLGDTRDRHVDVRILAATVRDLPTEVREHRFREDLFYRLNVVTLHVPALRDRRDDIPLLIDYFVERNNSKLGTAIAHVDEDARKQLVKYAWPGNVRELENVIERAMVLADGKSLGVGDLPERITAGPSPVAQMLATDNLSVKRATRVIEEALIRRALEQTHGNRTAAAKLLELSHRALLYKIKEYAIE